MNDMIRQYLKELGAPQVLVERVEAATQAFKFLCGSDPEQIFISETMRREESGEDAVGIWNAGRIVIKRDQLKKMESYAGTLLHEAAHALSGAGDVSREFELKLTYIIGKISNKSVQVND